MSLWWWLSRNDPPLGEGEGELPTWVQWVFGAFFVVPLAAFIAVNVFVGEEQPDPDDRAEIAALEDKLRPRGAAEDKLVRYEAALQQIADELSRRQPGLTWRWDPQRPTSGCDGEFEDTSGVHLRRRLLASQPIPEDQWTPAHQLVRDEGTEVGVSYVSGFALPNGDGGAIDLTQRDVAVLSGLTPCLLRRDEIERGG